MMDIYQSHPLLPLSSTQWGVWGSPPCPYWSVANTTGEKSEQKEGYAKAFVTQIRLIADVLGATYVVRAFARLPFSRNSLQFDCS